MGHIGSKRGREAWLRHPHPLRSKRRCRHALAVVLFALIAVVQSYGPARALCDVGSPCVGAPLDLGTLGGTVSEASGVSADGSVVVG